MWDSTGQCRYEGHDSIGTCKKYCVPTFPTSSHMSHCVRMFQARSARPTLIFFLQPNQPLSDRQGESDQPHYTVFVYCVSSWLPSSQSRRSSSVSASLHRILLFLPTNVVSGRTFAQTFSLIFLPSTPCTKADGDRCRATAAAIAIATVIVEAAAGVAVAARTPGTLTIEGWATIAGRGRVLQSARSASCCGIA